MLGRDKKSASSGASASQDYRNHTLIAPSAKVTGDIEFTGGLHVQGTVEGNISVGKDGGRLVIGETACSDSLWRLCFSGVCGGVRCRCRGSPTERPGWRWHG